MELGVWRASFADFQLSGVSAPASMSLRGQLYETESTCQFYFLNLLKSESTLLFIFSKSKRRQTLLIFRNFLKSVISGIYT